MLCFPFFNYLCNNNDDDDDDEKKKHTLFFVVFFFQFAVNTEPFIGYMT